jgi:hypothetical protein
LRFLVFIAINNELKNEELQIEDAIKILDFALLLGSPDFRDHIHTLIDDFQQRYVQKKTSLSNPRKTEEEKFSQDEMESSLARKKQKTQSKMKPRNKALVLFLFFVS